MLSASISPVNGRRAPTRLCQAPSSAVVEEAAVDDPMTISGLVHQQNIGWVTRAGGFPPKEALDLEEDEPSMSHDAVEEWIQQQLGLEENRPSPSPETRKPASRVVTGRLAVPGATKWDISRPVRRQLRTTSWGAGRPMKKLTTEEKKNDFTGRAKYTVDGLHYEGSWRCGKMHGRGKLTWLGSGDFFEGIFEHDQLKESSPYRSSAQRGGMAQIQRYWGAGGAGGGVGQPLALAKPQQKQQKQQKQRALRQQTVQKTRVIGASDGVAGPTAIKRRDRYSRLGTTQRLFD